MAEDGSDDPYDVGTTWEGYSNYQAVSRDIAKSVSEAGDSFAWLQARHIEGASLEPARVAEERSNILGAAHRLYVEMAQEVEENGDETYEEMLERWGGPLCEANGRLDQLREVSLVYELPGWLQQFVVDIRTAGWQLGYLKAGRRTREKPDDPVEEEIEETLSGL